MRVLAAIGWLGVLLGALPGALVGTPANAQAPAVPASSTCAVADLTTLRECLRTAMPGGRIVFTRDVVCRTAQECCPGGAAPIRIAGLAGVTLDGQGHALRREAGQKSCQAVVVRHATDITIANLTFDEDNAAAPCELAEKSCPSTLDLGASQGLTLDRVRVLSGKGYVVKLWTVTDFTMRRSEIADAGIIAFYAGHYKYGASARLTIDDSRFLRARANGMALQGVDDVVLRGNRFQGNHWHGLWPVPNVPGGITPGGQLLLAQGSRMSVEGNVFVGSDCGNCKPSKLVTAIEVGEGPDSPGVKELSITANRVCHDGPGMAIYHNPGAPGGEAKVTGNRFSGFTGVDNIRGPVTRAANIIAHGDTCP